jgi:hypothetical protein
MRRLCLLAGAFMEVHSSFGRHALVESDTIEPSLIQRTPGNHA